MNSIALTAFIRPSRILRGMLIFFLGTLSCSLAWLLWQGALWLSALAGLLVLPCLASLFRPQQVLQLDISGGGQIRLTRPVPAMPPAALARARRLPSNVWSSAVKSIVREHGEVVHVCPGSTLWPVLLLLQLETESTRKIRVIIMRDSVSEAVFCTLIVAIKAISFKGLDADKNPEKKMKNHAN